ncbi:hypothetical protein [Noviherbaspirillum cavernae]|uniref:hypothetical protein n=1 Tax=Noviherbaspirillum cavernae TaxID=2320862 RepID=UPI0018F6E4A2|nr:hypothetical protein [Noviherbaspirillum cavernae]
MESDFADEPSTRKAREAMPEVAAWIDSLREAFGREQIDACIRIGIRDGSFWAMENGRTIGTPPAEARSRIEKEWQELGQKKEPGGEGGQAG